MHPLWQPSLCMKQVGILRVTGRRSSQGVSAHMHCVHCCVLPTEALWAEESVLSFWPRTPSSAPAPSMLRDPGISCSTLSLSLPRYTGRKMSSLISKISSFPDTLSLQALDDLFLRPHCIRRPESLRVALFVHLTKCPFQPISSIPGNNSSGTDKRHSSGSQAQLSCHTE